MLDKLGDRAQAIARGEAALKIFEQIEGSIAEGVRKQLAAWKSVAALRHFFWTAWSTGCRGVSSSCQAFIGSKAHSSRPRCFGKQGGMVRYGPNEAVTPLKTRRLQKYGRSYLSSGRAGCEETLRAKKAGEGRAAR